MDQLVLLLKQAAPEAISCVTDALNWDHRQLCRSWCAVDEGV